MRTTWRRRGFLLSSHHKGRVTNGKNLQLIIARLLRHPQVTGAARVGPLQRIITPSNGATSEYQTQLQQLLGHDRIETTTRYLLVRTDRIRAVDSPLRKLWT